MTQRILQSPGPAFRVTAFIALAAMASCQAAAQTTGKSACGTFERPFAANSPWNSRPVEPVLGTATIPPSDYYPTVSIDKYSTAVYRATPQDGPVTILPMIGQTAVWDPDAEAHRPSVTIPHWPANAVPASGSDGHLDVIDVENGIVHSLFKLKNVDGQWRALMYAWSPLKGAGWGRPAHYYQGARAAGVPTAGGVIRTHEAHDGAPMYSHALAMSLTFNALSAKNLYVYPATSTDGNAATTNYGEIPIGSLMMLPKDFNVASIANPDLRKVALTLQVYGAYVVDRNVGTPFVIYADINSDLILHRKPDGSRGWDNVVATDLQRIRAALRPVVSTKAWVDCDGNAFQPDMRFNLLSMRGPWSASGTGLPGSYDTWRQALVFPASQGEVTMTQWSGNVWGRVAWGRPVAGKTYTLKVTGSPGTKMRLTYQDCGAVPTKVDTGELQPGGMADIVWPEKLCRQALTATKTGSAESWVRGELWPR